MKPSIFESEKDPQLTIVAFGRGTIQMGVATDDHGQVMIHLADVMRENPVGLDLGKWEGAKGRTVMLGFDNPKSLEVLAKTIEEAREAFSEKTRNDNSVDLQIEYEAEGHALGGQLVPLCMRHAEEARAGPKYRNDPLNCALCIQPAKRTQDDSQKGDKND